MYRITVQEITEVTKKEMSWEKVAPYKTNDGKEHYYADVERKMTKTNENEVYKQEVEEFDLIAVIEAVNK